MTVSDDLDAAADVLEKEGWSKEWYLNPADGTHCAVGSIRKVAGFGVENDISYRYLSPEYKSRIGRIRACEQALMEHLDLNSSVETWNDRSERTAEEVIQAMRDTATKNRSDEMRSK